MAAIKDDAASLWTVRCGASRQARLDLERRYAKWEKDVAHMQAFVDKWLHNKFGYNAGPVDYSRRRCALCEFLGFANIELVLQAWLFTATPLVVCKC